MKSFSDPLNNIRIASPCKADWNQMYGNDRKRFCAECKLNVYNLSDMTRDQAEGFLIASEGRVCVRYFRRADGTVLTRNCPVGWRAVVSRTSNALTAACTLLLGVFLGLLGLRATDSLVSLLPMGDVPRVEEQSIQVLAGGFDREGLYTDDDSMLGLVDSPRHEPKGRFVEGRVENIEDFRKKNVVVWIR